MLHALVCVHALLYATAFLFSLRLLALPMGLYFGAVFFPAPLGCNPFTLWRHSPLVEAIYSRHLVYISEYAYQGMH